MVIGESIGQLMDEGIMIGRHRVAKYMKVPDVKALYPTKKKNTPMRNKANAIIYPSTCLRKKRS